MKRTNPVAITAAVLATAISTYSPSVPALPVTTVGGNPTVAIPAADPLPEPAVSTAAADPRQVDIDKVDMTAAAANLAQLHGRSLAERVSEYHRGRGWERMPPERAIKRDLMDARLYLIRAETDQFSKWAPEDRPKVHRRVEDELRTAELFVEEALVQTPVQEVARRNDIEAAADGLRAIQLSRAAMQDRSKYRQSRNALRDLISVHSREDDRTAE